MYIPYIPSSPKLPQAKNIILFSIVVIMLAALCYTSIDKDIATWGYYTTRQSNYYPIWEYATYLMPLYFNLTPWILIYLILNINKINNSKYRDLYRVLFIMVISTWLTLMLNEQLRFIFGRHWPATWFHGNLSWVQHKAYGFTWFKNQHEFKSFPSGHTSLIFAFMMPLYWQVSNKKVKIFAIVTSLVVPVGLILMCYHFMSDVLIGMLIGILSSYLILSGYIKLTRDTS